MKFVYSFVLVLCSINLFGSPKLNISEINQSIPDLGGYVSIKDHPKAKGVNMKLKAPIGWQISEGDRPNVVKKFVKDGNTFMVLVKDNMTFFSRKEIKELFKDDKFTNELILELGSTLQSLQLIDKSVVTVDNYPALSFKVSGNMERTGLKFPVIMKCWICFYEDKVVFLQSAGINNSNFKLLEILYSSIINSVIFPEQYN
jgi:hypothetical protein